MNYEFIVSQLIFPYLTFRSLLVGVDIPDILDRVFDALLHI